MDPAPGGRAAPSRVARCPSVSPAGAQYGQYERLGTYYRHVHNESTHVRSRKRVLTINLRERNTDVYSISKFISFS
jgi:hypothetical protein